MRAGAKPGEKVGKEDIIEKEKKTTVHVKLCKFFFFFLSYAQCVCVCWGKVCEWEDLREKVGAESCRR